MMKEIFGKIDELLLLKDNVVIAIDGMCGAGKSTLAEQIDKHYDCNVIHCDDFFLPIKLRSEERLSEPGGNIHYERMYKEVISKLNKQIIYKKFDCKKQEFGKDIILNLKRITIIEGSYSLHPYFGKYYDYSIFLKVSNEIQEERIIKRNGIDKWEMFKNRWIILENRYFESYKIEGNADLVIDTDF